MLKRKEPYDLAKMRQEFDMLVQIKNVSEEKAHNIWLQYVTKLHIGHLNYKQHINLMNELLDE